jgi:hypothetical protein
MRLRLSTTGAVEATKSYFSYTVLTLCGIPQITLLGNESDWRSIRSRAAVLAELGRDWWLCALLPVLDQFVEAAAGRVDRQFWSSLYKEKSESGAAYITGWINVFFPYLLRERSRRPRVVQNGWVAALKHGPTANQLPSGLSSAPFTWRFLDRAFAMEFVAGFVGVSQDRETRAVRPAIGWCIRGLEQPR